MKTLFILLLTSFLFFSCSHKEMPTPKGDLFTKDDISKKDKDSIINKRVSVIGYLTLSENGNTWLRMIKKK